MRGQALPLRLLLQSLLIAAAFTGGCALRSYSPAPLDPVASARAFGSRSLDSPAVRDYFVAHGYPGTEWPMRSWRLPELTLLAFYYHPDLEVARAQAKTARADLGVASQRARLTLMPFAEHHSARTENSSSPWSAGFDIEIPVAGAANRQALRERYGYLADAAALKVGSTAWEVRSRVQSCLLNYYASTRTADLAEAELRERVSMAQLLQRRLEAGAVSALEASRANLGVADAQTRLRAARAAQERDSAALAQALAVPLSVVEQMALDFASFEHMEPAPADQEARRAALLNRLDVRTGLLEYAAADAEVKWEVARQYPSFTLMPGYLWDQGDNVWSLAVGMVLPPMLGNRAGIELAEARRELVASQFIRLQNQTLSQAEGALAVYAKLTDAQAEAEQMSALSSGRMQQIQKQFDAGYADRVELTQARLEALAASRGALAARLDALRARGELEDALQIPLAGSPLPSAVAAPAKPASGVAQE